MSRLTNVQINTLMRTAALEQSYPGSSDPQIKSIAASNLVIVDLLQSILDKMVNTK